MAGEQAYRFSPPSSPLDTNLNKGHRVLYEVAHEARNV